MIKRLISKYSLRYIRSLVYMMQSSEYKLSDFYTWYKRVQNFGDVEKRKTLVFTTKVKVIYFLSWVFALLYVAISVKYILFAESAFGTFLIIFVFAILWPIALVIFVIALVFCINFLQKPIEKRIIGVANRKLKKHEALKIAVAGSFGKTTMKEMLKTVLSKKFKVSATPDNKNTPLGISKFIHTLDFDEEVLIFELGEYYKGDIEELCLLVRPNIGIITGINEAHLEKFLNTKNTTDTIFELADYLKEKPESKLYANGESDLVKERVNRYKTILYSETGIKGESESSVSARESDLEGTRFIFKSGGNRVVANSKILGLHQIGPLSCVIHLALNLGMKVEDIEMGIRETKAFEHRLEPKEIDGGVTVIDDSYNGNPDGVYAAIRFLNGISGKRRFYITPGLVEMGTEHQSVHKEIGRALALSDIEKVVLVRNSATAFIDQGLRENGYKGDVIWFDSAQECFTRLPRQTISNDLLLYQNDWTDNYS